MHFWVLSNDLGEFEKHEACWMGWPYDGGLWRADAKPAQEQYANVAKAISEFEPLIMFADPQVCSCHVISITQIRQP